MRPYLRSTQCLLIGLAVFHASLSFIFVLADGQWGHVDNPISLVQIDHSDSLSIAPNGGYPLYGNADHNAVLGY